MVHEPVDASGAFADDDIDRHLVAEARAGDQGVAHVRLEAVVLGQDAGDASLGVAGVGLVEGALGDDDHVTVFGGLESKGEAGDAGADDEVIAREAHDGGAS